MKWLEPYHSHHAQPTTRGCWLGLLKRQKSFTRRCFCWHRVFRTWYARCDALSTSATMKQKNHTQGTRQQPISTLPLLVRDVEAEVEDVPFFNDVFLALAPQHPLLFRVFFAPAGHQVVVSDRLRANETPAMRGMHRGVGRGRLSRVGRNILHIKCVSSPRRQTIWRVRWGYQRQEGGCAEVHAKSAKPLAAQKQNGCISVGNGDRARYTRGYCV